MCIPGIAGVLKEFAFGGEDYEGHFSITMHRDLMCFLEQTRPSLWERHLPIDLVLDPLQLHPSSPHISLYHTLFYYTLQLISSTTNIYMILSYYHYYTYKTIPTRISIINDIEGRSSSTLQLIFLYRCIFPYSAFLVLFFFLCMEWTLWFIICYQHLYIYVRESYCCCGRRIYMSHDRESHPLIHSFIFLLFYL